MTQAEATMRPSRYAVTPLRPQEDDMPTIYRRKDSQTWWMTYTDCDGHRRRESTGTRDEKLAAMVLGRREHLHFMAREGFISREQLRAQDKGRTTLDELEPTGHVKTFIEHARLRTANDFSGDT